MQQLDCPEGAGAHDWTHSWSVVHALQLPPPLLELLAPLLELLPLLEPDPEPEELPLPPELELAVAPLLLLVVPPLLDPEPEPEPLLDVASESPASELWPTEFAAPLHAQATTTSDADKRRTFPTAPISPYYAARTPNAPSGSQRPRGHPQPGKLPGRPWLEADPELPCAAPCWLSSSRR